MKKLKHMLSLAQEYWAIKRKGDIGMTPVEGTRLWRNSVMQIQFMQRLSYSLRWFLSILMTLRSPSLQAPNLWPGKAM